MSAFSNLDASANASDLLGYLDETDRGLSSMKAYIAAIAGRYARGEPVLDLGCGVGHDLVRLQMSGAFPVGIDISALALSRAKTEGYPVVRGEAALLPFATDAFAGCRVERVLQHVADPGDVLDEVVRVVRPGGFIAVFEPDFETFRVESEVVPDGTIPGRFVAVRHRAIGNQVAALLRSRSCAIVDIVTEASFAYRLDAIPLSAAALTQRGVDDGAMRVELREAWLEEQKRRSHAGTFNATWTKILTVARTPPATDRTP